MTPNLRRLATIGWFISLVSASGQTSFDGRFYEQAAVVFGDRSANYLGLTILGLNLDSDPVESVRIRASVELPIDHDQRAVQPGPQIRTLNAAFSAGPSKLTVGRFLPLWGVCRIFRPMDLFRTQTFVQNALSSTGVDGLFWKLYAGSGALGLIALPEKDIGNTRMALWAEEKFDRLELQSVMMYDPGTPSSTIGMTAQADFFATLKAEALYRNGIIDWNGNTTAWKVSLGADWSFWKYFFISAGYFFDNTGAFKKEKYTVVRLLEPGRMTLGRHYIEADWSVLTWDETKFGVSGLWNLTDRSAVIWPYVSKEWFDNVFLGVSWYWFTGTRRAEFASTTGHRHLLNLYCYARF
jgi:hypothetical protein